MFSRVLTTWDNPSKAPHVRSLVPNTKSLPSRAVTETSQPSIIHPIFYSWWWYFYTCQSIYGYGKKKTKHPSRLVGRRHPGWKSCLQVSRFRHPRIQREFKGRSHLYFSRRWALRDSYRNEILSHSVLTSCRRRRRWSVTRWRYLWFWKIFTGGGGIVGYRRSAITGLDSWLCHLSYARFTGVDEVAAGGDVT